MKARQRPRQKKRATRRENLQMACVFLALWLAISVFLVFAAERQAEAYRAEPYVVMGTLQDARRVWSRNHMELEVWIGGVGCETDDGWLGWTYGLSDTLEGLEQRLEAQVGSLARAEYARLGKSSVLVRLNVDGVEYIDAARSRADHISEQETFRNLFIASAALSAAALIGCLCFLRRGQHAASWDR